MKEGIGGGWDFVFALHTLFPFVKDRKESMEER